MDEDLERKGILEPLVQRATQAAAGTGPSPKATSGSVSCLFLQVG